MKLSLKLFYLLLAALIAVPLSQSTGVSAQTPTPTPVPPPTPNALLIYDNTTVALINTSKDQMYLLGLRFERAGGSVKYDIVTLYPALPPGNCVQVWTADVTKIIGKPTECTIRARYTKLAQRNTYFWVATFDGETFRPQFNSKTLTICKASSGEVERCPLYVPQGDAQKQTWTVVDPASGQPMAPGMAVAYDNDQLWIGNLTPNTVLPTGSSSAAYPRLYYSANGKNVVWTPFNGAWDIGKWDGRPLQGGQCLVLYDDPNKVTPLLPCTPIAKALLADQPWRLQFDVSGPREDRRSTCSSDKPPTGPVLCLVGG